MSRFVLSGKLTLVYFKNGVEYHPSKISKSKNLQTPAALMYIFSFVSAEWISSRVVESLNLQKSAKMSIVPLGERSFIGLVLKCALEPQTVQGIF